MKQLLTLILSSFMILLLYYGESRKFYCTGTSCITVWKTYNNKCYIISGKYYGLLKPVDNYIETTNTNDFTAFFSDDLPKILIFKAKYKCIVININKFKVNIIPYEKYVNIFDNKLYNIDAKNISDMKIGAYLIDCNIEEGYAVDKYGKKI